MTPPARTRGPAPAPLWRQAFDAAERAVAPHAENLVGVAEELGSPAG